MSLDILIFRINNYDLICKYGTECYDSGVHGIWVKISICGPNTTENNVVTKLYNRIVSA